MQAFFGRNGARTLSVRCVFEFISNFGGAATDAAALQLKFEQLILEEEERPQRDDEVEDVNDAVFAQSFIPRNLAEVLPPPRLHCAAVCCRSKS